MKTLSKPILESPQNSRDGVHGSVVGIPAVASHGAVSEFMSV